MLKSFKSVIYTNDKSLPSRFSCNFTPVSQIFLSVWKLFNQPPNELHEAVFVRRQSLGCSEHQASLFSAWHHDSKDLLWGFWAPRSGCRKSMKTTCCTVAAAFRLNIQCVCEPVCACVGRAPGLWFAGDDSVSLDVAGITPRSRYTQPEGWLNPIKRNKTTSRRVSPAGWRSEQSSFICLKINFQWFIIVQRQLLRGTTSSLLFVCYTH